MPARKNVPGAVQRPNLAPSHQAAPVRVLPPKQTSNENVIISLVMKTCRMILFTNTSLKVVLYLVGVMVVSSICDIYHVPETSLANKRNCLNEYFIKKGWGITLTFVGLYIVLTSAVYCFRDTARLFQHMMRLVVGSIWWYACTSFFIRVEKNVGACSLEENTDMAACREAGGTWSGFDISGHIFLEIHCLLIISEEAKTLRAWSKLGDMLLDQSLRAGRRVFSDSQIQQAQGDYKSLTPIVKVIFALLAVLILMFEFMLVVSAVYRFHTPLENALAACVAVACWFLSYQVVFRSGNPYPFLPVMPGHSPLQFMDAN